MARLPAIEEAHTAKYAAKASVESSRDDDDIRRVLQERLRTVQAAAQAAPSAEAGPATTSAPVPLGPVTIPASIVEAQLAAAQATIAQLMAQQKAALEAAAAQQQQRQQQSGTDLVQYTFVVPLAPADVSVPEVPSDPAVLKTAEILYLLMDRWSLASQGTAFKWADLRASADAEPEPERSVRQSARYTRALGTPKRSVPQSARWTRALGTTERSVGQSAR